MAFAALCICGCSSNGNREYASFEDYPAVDGEWEEMKYSPEKTEFALWAPTADSVMLRIYDSYSDELPVITEYPKITSEGLWEKCIKADLKGKFYTFEIKHNGRWLGETPGIVAKAVGVNGLRAAVINLDDTDPEGWENDRRPELGSFSDVIIYEMHHRDFSVSETSGIVHKGKFLALTEEGTVNPHGVSTGIDHLKELGVTHVHILPSYDYNSVDETRLDEPQYNWGYDPVNYNVPDGSYSTDPYTPETRIKEFKEMVMSLHKAGIRVIMDVVYNHTALNEGSNFELTVPGYFYRKNEDGTFADGSACGNETASEREMVRKFITESVCYWAKEYHIDGFRFDLMGIHDIETMNHIRSELSKIDSSILIYGEGWAAKPPKYPFEKLAMKANTHLMPGIAAFSDEFRDSLRGNWNNDTEGAFVTGRPGHEYGIMFGIVGAISHPDLQDTTGTLPAPWAAEPTQMISYVSCHDDHCIGDRLKITAADATAQERLAMYKLAESAVFTSQGIPFIFNGDEVIRDKKGVKNSYNSPDLINMIDWNLKSTNSDAFNYVKGLIAMRKSHPAFQMGKAELVREHLHFIAAEDNVVAFHINGEACGDSWKDIIVILNSNKTAKDVQIPEGEYVIVCRDGVIDTDGLGTVSGDEVKVNGVSALIIRR